MRLLYVVIAISLVVLPVYAGTFRDDFENEEDFLNDKQLREGGVWGEDITFYTWENGAIKGRNDLAGFFVALITGDYGWKDYTVEFRAKIITDFDFDLDAIALLLRRQCIDCNDVYFFIIGRTPGGTNKVGIVGKDPETPLVGAPFQISKDVWYTFKGVVQGEQLEFYVDDELVLEAEDDAFASGKAGFAVQNAGGEPMEALFDDFAMTGPEVKDGGHWKGQPQSKAVSSYSKLANTWGNIKYSR